MHPLRRTKLAALAVGLGLFVAACGGTTGASGPAKAGDAQQVLRINTDTQPNSLDPGQQSYDYEGIIGRQTFEALLKPAKTGTGLAGNAASSWDVSSDGMTVTFHLRENYYNDGVRVKAADFVYGWQRILDPTLAAGYVDPFFDSIVKGADTYTSLDPKADAAKIPAFLAGLGLSAPDDNTFVVKLQHPASWFLNVASLWVGAPIRKDVVAKYGANWATVPAQVIGNGKYMVSELVANDHITLVPNPHYKGDQTQLKQIISYFIPDANTAFNKYKTGGLDVLQIPIDNTDVVKADAKLKNEYKVYPAPGGFWMTYNNKVAPFDNPKVRLAFARAINRDELSAKVSHGQYKPVSVFIPEGVAGYDPSNGSIQKYDPTAAKSLLDSAGAKASDLASIHILIRDTTSNKLLGQYIQAQLQDHLGVKITLDVVDSKTVTKRIRKGDFQIYGPDGWGMDYGHPQDIMDTQLTGGCHGIQWGCYSSTVYDAGVTKGDGEKDLAPALKDYATAEKQLLQDAPIGIMFNRPDWMLVKPYVQGITSTPYDEAVYMPGDQWTDTLFISQH